MEKLKNVIWSGITIGTWKASPKVPSLKAGAKEVSHSFGALHTVNFVNCILNIPGAVAGFLYRQDMLLSTNAPKVYLAFYSVSHQIQVHVRHLLAGNDRCVWVELGLLDKRVATPTRIVLEEQDFRIKIGS